MPDHNPVDISKIRARLTGVTGKDYWRSLEELADTPDFQTFVQQEFPQALVNTPVSRRRFLQLAAASLALAGMAACSPRSAKQIIPYVVKPDGLIPGEPQFYATAHSLSGYATGVLVESNTGRPTRIEGNPNHPTSLGALDVFAQASILSLYDPERAQTVLNKGQASSWDAFISDWKDVLGTSGQGVRILTTTVTSPTLMEQMAAFIEQFPDVQWHQYEPINGDNVSAGTQMAFGQALMPVYQFENADVILSLDADFLFTEPGRLRYTRAFSDKRRINADQVAMNRLYVVESTPTITGSMADHRLRLRPSDVERFARALAERLGLSGAAPADVPQAWTPWLDALANDLKAHGGTSLVTAGAGQPPVVHTLAAWINATLGSIGQTVTYIEPLFSQTNAQVESLRTLTADMQSGNVSALLIIGGNPAYTASADILFAEALAKLPFSAHLSLYEDETSANCVWQLPMTHDLETWGDARAYDGTTTILQPLIQPMYDTRSALGLLESALAASADQMSSDHDIVQGHWQNAAPTDDFDTFWGTALRDGLVANSAAKPVSVTLADFTLPDAPAATEGLELTVRPDPSIWDGTFNNNGWLQELPKPFTKLTWDNAALISPATAERLGLTDEVIVQLQTQAGGVNAPIMILPGQADDCITVTLGYGRTHTGKVGTETGFNAYPLLTLPAWFSTGLTINPLSERYKFARTQNHFSMEGRDLIRAGTLDDYQQDPTFGFPKVENPSLYPDFPVGDYSWGMSIDLNACIGCNACIIGCQAENNIQVVGKEQVEAGREMHWLRVDGYFSGNVDDPKFFLQPVPCMHCEKAPCEVVCPVQATVHDSEGLNEMIYNRCVGTRYCSNNCPYKVRRFNFFDYTDPDLRVLNNPEVTVRDRGVMEKCTYCIQRIEAARIKADDEGRRIGANEIKTACQAACPANAIVFGNIADPTTEVAQRKAQPRDYALLAELNTRPRTTYLSKLTNPNPALANDSLASGMEA